jgi:sec-independent protein translocase protein TatA
VPLEWITTGLEHNMTLGFLQNIGGMEYLMIGVVMLLLFGRRLPEVGRSLGKGLVEFKKGLRDVDDEVKGVDHSISHSAPGGSPQFSSASRAPLGPAGEERRVHTAEEVRPGSESNG